MNPKLLKLRRCNSKRLLKNLSRKGYYNISEKIEVKRILKSRGVKLR